MTQADIWFYLACFLAGWGMSKKAKDRQDYLLLAILLMLGSIAVAIQAQ